MKRHANIPDEGQRNQDDLIRMLFAEAAELFLLGDWSDFHFDVMSDCAGYKQAVWWIGDPNEPDYGSVCEPLYIPDGHDLLQFDEDKCCDWIDTFHEFRFDHSLGLGVDGGCVNCGSKKWTLDEDADKPWCLECDDWAHLKRESE